MAGRAVVNLAGEHLLAGAVLARDEDVGIGGGHLLDNLADAHHRRARAPEHRLLVGQFALDFLELLHLALRAGQVVGPLQGGDQTVVVPGLDHEIDGPVAHGPHRQVDVGIGREEHQLDVGIVAVNLLQPVEALVAGVDSGREVHVEQDDVDGLATQRRQQLVGRRQGQHAGEVVAHEQLDGGQDAAVVVDDEQGSLFCFGHVFRILAGVDRELVTGLWQGFRRATRVFRCDKISVFEGKKCRNVQIFYTSVKIFYTMTLLPKQQIGDCKHITYFGTRLATIGAQTTKV